MEIWIPLRTEVRRHKEAFEAFLHTARRWDHEGIRQVAHEMHTQILKTMTDQVIQKRWNRNWLQATLVTIPHCSELCSSITPSLLRCPSMVHHHPLAPTDFWVSVAKSPASPTLPRSVRASSSYSLVATCRKTLSPGTVPILLSSTNPTCSRNCLAIALAQRTVPPDIPHAVTMLPDQTSKKDRLRSNWRDTPNIDRPLPTTQASLTRISQRQDDAPPRLHSPDRNKIPSTGSYTLTVTTQCLPYSPSRCNHPTP